MKKSIIGISALVGVATGLVVGLVIGFTTDQKLAENSPTGANISQQSRGNYDVFEAIKLIEPDYSFQDINQLLGFEGEVVSPTNSLGLTRYEWEISDDTSIEASISESNGKVTTSATAVFPDSMIENSKVDFSRANEMKSKINSAGGLYYDEVVKILGGAEGTLDYVDSFSHKYLWVSTDGGTLHATFDNNNKCTIYTGMF